MYPCQGSVPSDIMSIVPSCWVVLKIKDKVFGESDPVPGTKCPYSSLLSAYWKSHTGRPELGPGATLALCSRTIHIETVNGSYS